MLEPTINATSKTHNCQADSPSLCDRMDDGPHKSTNSLEAIDKLLSDARTRYEKLCYNELLKLCSIAYRNRVKPDVAIIANRTFVGSLCFESPSEACSFVRMLIVALDEGEYIPF